MNKLKLPKDEENICCITIDYVNGKRTTRIPVPDGNDIMLDIRGVY